MSITESVLSPGWSEAEGPVAVLLHGYGSHEGDLAGLAPWLPPGMAWSSVRAPERHPAVGFAWFPLQLPEEPDPHAVTRATDQLWSWIDDHVAPERPLLPIGFSQGGLMAMQLLRTRPARAAAAVVLSGLLASAAQPADALLAARRPPVFWSHGDRDDVLPQEGVERLAAFLPSHTHLTRRTYPGLGHSVDARVMDDVREFLAGAVSGTD